MSGKDSTAAGQRRSQRQRIDLGGAGEGFDRHELEQALKASLEEERRREKTDSGKKRPLSKKKVAVVEGRITKRARSPPKKKDDNKSEVPKKVEDNKGEKTAAKRKPINSGLSKEQGKKTIPETKPAGNKRADKLQATELPGKKKRTSAAIESGKKSVKKVGAAKPVAKVSRAAANKKTVPFVSQRVSELGRRPAATQASDFITLLACATKVISGLDQKTDYVF